MSAETDRLDALEAWVDAVIPTLRAITRRTLGVGPDKDASGADAGLLAVDEGSEPAAVRAAVPKRA